MRRRADYGDLWLAKRGGDVAFLTRTLDDPDPDRQLLAVRFLGQLDATEAAPAIRALLDADTSRVRTAALVAIRKLDAKEALPDVLELVEHEPTPVTRAWAIAVLGSLGDEKSEPLLESLLHDDDWTIRRAAAWALASRGDRSVRPALETARSNERSIRRRLFYRRALRRLSAKGG